MGLLTVLVLAAILQCTEGMKCFSCTGQADLSTCVKQVQCASDEECYVERIVGEHDNVFYNVGCRKLQVCKFLALAHPKRANLAICQECCGQNLCNHDICVRNLTLREIDCYQCAGVKSPSHCHNRVTCKLDEICSSTEYLDDNMEVKYRLGCENKARCDLLNITKRQIPFCSQCCPLSGCNRQLCGFRGETATDTKPPTITPMSSSTLETVSATTETTPTIDATTSTASKPVATATKQTVTSSTISQQNTGTTSHCTDSVEFDCQAMNNTVDICNPISTATVLYCPRFCGICDLLDTTTALTTTPAPCVDVPDVDCKGLNDILDICHPITIQTKLCLKFCDLCGYFTTTPPPITTTPAPCVDVVDCKGLSEIVNICHPVTEQTKLCRRFCGLCGLTKSTTSKSLLTSTLSDVTSITTTKTPVLRTTKTTSTPVPQTTKKPVESLCYQCGDLKSNKPCSPRELVLGHPSPCPDKYCMNDVIVQADGISYDIYKRCTNRDECRRKWFFETSDNDVCTSLEDNGPIPDLICHFCCVGDACNHGMVPDPLYDE